MLFAILGAVAVVVLWLVDGNGTASRRTRVAMAVLVLAEMVAAVLIGEFRSRQILYLLAGFAVVAFTGYLVAEVIRRVVIGMTGNRPVWILGYLGRRFFTPRRQNANGDLEPAWRLWLRRVWQAVPPAILVAAVVAAFSIDHASNRVVLVLVPIAIAAILFVAPGPSLAADADDPKDLTLRPPRAALAATSFGLSGALPGPRRTVARASPRSAAVVLAGLCLTVAWGVG